MRLVEVLTLSDSDSRGSGAWPFGVILAGSCSTVGATAGGRGGGGGGGMFFPLEARGSRLELLCPELCLPLCAERLASVGPAELGLPGYEI